MHRPIPLTQHPDVRLNGMEQEERIEALLGHLTLAQKAAVVAGSTLWTTTSLPDAGVPLRDLSSTSRAVLMLVSMTIFLSQPGIIFYALVCPSTNLWAAAEGERRTQWGSRCLGLSRSGVCGFEWIYTPCSLAGGPPISICRLFLLFTKTFFHLLKSPLASP